MVRIILIGVIRNACCQLTFLKLILLHSFAYIDKNIKKIS
ncbi:hypothetical protein TSAR_010911 [Trichomalopsis sarcophagae]|uniref:Uncharacterized protein n=1 Tax=Trichomalopsis sarcophagae TaxID=543379 RepID=A0A232EDA6_9HYME|nr:hypothetical protein TSAR_010911 [Trichomalopsis sarcophagae]